MGGEAQILLAALAFVAFVASIARWRLAVIGALLLLLFEGALRKWALPEAQAQLYLAKDVLLLGAYVGFIASRGIAVPVRQAQPLLVLLAMTIVWGTVQLLNPALPSAALALVGWRSYFFYAPLIFLVPHLFGSTDQLYQGLRRYALLAAPLALLGLVQFYSPIDSIINTNVEHEPGVSTIVGFASGNRVRVGGSFSFVSGYASYLLVAALLIMALLAASAWRLRRNALLYGTLALTIAAMFATGSRGPVYLLIAIVACYALAAAASGDLSFNTAVRACLGGALLAVALWQFLPEPAEAFYSRAAASGEETLSRFVSPIIEPFLILERVGPAGFGIGAAHQSAAFLVGSAYPWWTDGIVAEAETSRVMLELGILGFALVFLFRVWVALWALRAALRLKSRPARSLALLLALYLGVQVFGAVIFNPTMNVLYWFAVGLMFAICRFEARDALAAGTHRFMPALRLHRSA